MICGCRKETGSSAGNYGSWTVGNKSFNSTNGVSADRGLMLFFSDINNSPNGVRLITFPDLGTHPILVVWGPGMGTVSISYSENGQTRSYSNVACTDSFTVTSDGSNFYFSVPPIWLYPYSLVGNYNVVDTTDSVSFSATNLRYTP